MNGATINIEKYFLVPHFKVIATYPGMKEKIGELIYPSTHEYAQKYLDHPAVFQRQEWWEDRSISELMEIEFIEVHKKGYYAAGDKIRVFHFLFEDLNTKHPRIVGFAAAIDKSRTLQSYKLTECIPATGAELLTHKD